MNLDYKSIEVQERLADKYDLRLISRNKNEVLYKCKCPFHKSDNGALTLAVMFISDFVHCYQCNYTSDLDTFFERVTAILYSKQTKGAKP